LERICPSPDGRGWRGGGFSYYLPHPDPLPSREREFFFTSFHELFRLIAFGPDYG
jgi:hypothetical protein